MTAILLKNGFIIDPFKEEIRQENLLIIDDYIKKIHPDFTDIPENTEVLDVKGKFISPGLIESHLHIESCMMPPLEFGYHAIQHGTTTCVVDPHEIANVEGVKGITLWLEQADKLPLDMYVGIPSCVPATHMEHSGASIGIAEIKKLIEDDRVYGLGEMMNFPGIIHDIGDARKKVDLVFNNKKIIDGHAPGVSGQDLDIYISNGHLDGTVRIMSDHEATTAKEVQEKIEKGMFIALRYGSATRDLDNILPDLIDQEANFDKIMFCSDDLSPSELYEKGHIDRIVRRAREIFQNQGKMELEKATITALRMATVNSSNYLQPFLDRTHRRLTGRLEPSYSANIVIFNDLESLTVDTVIHQGKIIVKDGELNSTKPEYDYSAFLHSMHISKTFSADDFIIPFQGTEKSVSVNIIQTVKDSLLTKKVIAKWPIQTVDGISQIRGDVAQDVLKIAVFERHHNTNQMAYGLIRGIGIKNGAIASTVAHDNHNLIVVGTNDRDMAQLTNEMIARGGGMGALIDGNVTFFPLQIAGLMASDPLPQIIASYRKVKETAQIMGSAHENVFMTLSFMALAVIPELRITDMGVVDVNQFKIIPLIQPTNE